MCISVLSCGLCSVTLKYVTTISQLPFVCQVCPQHNRQLLEGARPPAVIGTMRRFKASSGAEDNNGSSENDRMSGVPPGGPGHMSLEEAIEATRYADLHGGIITADDFESVLSEADANREPVILNVYDMFW